MLKLRAASLYPLAEFRTASLIKAFSNVTFDATTGDVEDLLDRTLVSLAQSLALSKNFAGSQVLICTCRCLTCSLHHWLSHTAAGKTAAKRCSSYWTAYYKARIPHPVRFILHLVLAVALNMHEV